MSQLQRAFKSLGGLALTVILPAMGYCQATNTGNFYAPQGGEYAINQLAGDQANSALSLNTNGGFVVWQDNITDGDGLGISASHLNASFVPDPSFRVNQQGAGDQENPHVALLSNGGAAFVWQSGRLSFQHIYARFLSSSNLWITGDVAVNTSTNTFQADPALAALPNGNIVVTWSSFGQDNADGLAGIYGQLLSPTGTKVGNEFRVNQFSPNNQRSSAVAAYSNGNFIVVWISEKERTSSQIIASGTNSGYNSVDVYARMFNAAGTAQGNEFLINTGTNVCTSPTVAAGSDGSYIVAWTQRTITNLNNGWDIFYRQFSSASVGGIARILNSQLYGDQYQPKLSAVGTNYLGVWTSLGQDGSREGIYSQMLQGDGGKVGDETRVNTFVLNQQLYPAIASDGKGRFLVTWSSFTNITTGLDLYGQAYANTAQPLSAPGAPIVTPVDSYILNVSWSPITAFNVTNFNIVYYDLYVDGSTLGIQVTNNSWSSVNFNPSSTHTFQIDYVLSDGRQSPLSLVATGTTWGLDRNHDGLPDDWEATYFGTNTSNWPANANTLLAPGVTVLDTFLWGANPNDPTTWLKQTITKTVEGLFLNWNTIPGTIYQVQISSDLKTWSSLGAPRFEPGNTDSIYLGFSPHGYYRIVRNRY